MAPKKRARRAAKKGAICGWSTVFKSQVASDREVVGPIVHGWAKIALIVFWHVFVPRRRQAPQVPQGRQEEACVFRDVGQILGVLCLSASINLRLLLTWSFNLECDCFGICSE